MMPDLLTPEQWLGDCQDGERLFEAEVGPWQTDDRRLYWRRLAGLEQLLLSGADTETLLTYERASRGYQPVSFSEASDVKIAVTGFDPFHLDQQITQSNPSGLVAQQLHGHRWQADGASFEIQSLLIPVRYRDFDTGLIESLFEPRLVDLDMIVTVSMGRDHFDLERFPGLRRSVATLDNDNLQGGGSRLTPIVPPGLAGPEFVEFSLPVEAMRPIEGEFQVRDNRTVTTRESGEQQAASLAKILSMTAVEGSGGGFLSNEISYRMLNLIQSTGNRVVCGHIHTPRMRGLDVVSLESISNQCRAMILAAASDFRPKKTPG